MTDIQVVIETILDRSVTWDFLHFDVKPYRIVAEDAYPLELAYTLLEEIGAVLQAEPDGSLIVRRKYKQEPSTVDQWTAEQVYTDSADNLTSQEEYIARDGYNRFRVTESDSQYEDVIEFIPDEDSITSGTLRVYPGPYRVNIQVRSTVLDSDIILTDGVWNTREEIEEVEFVDGEASTAYPIYQLSEVEWISASLSGVTFADYSTKLIADASINQGYGLAVIRYTTKSLDYHTSASAGDSVQYVVEEI